MHVFLGPRVIRYPLLILCFLLRNAVFGSEGAVRECCEPMSPTPSFSTTELPQEFYQSTEIVSPGDFAEINESGIVTLNCIMAKQVCMDDPLCGPTLDIVDRVCGSEVVSCSTVTVTKCQAALKTLQTFPFFNPTCLCREPQLDQKCNSFRTFLFDHPCLFAQRRENDPYPIDSLVSCTHAHSTCKKDTNCSRIYDHFKHVCRTTDDDKCIPELQESCKESWSKIRLTPMFGCICPPNLWRGRKKCDIHYNFVNHNRCAGSDLPVETNDVLMNFQSTCHHSVEMCQKNVKCATAIQAIIEYCSRSNCRREECQKSLQAFYRDKSLVRYAIEVAFCLCKKTNNSEEDTCMQAQDTLHPSCAQEVDTVMPPACHMVAASCRADPECGPLLEEFEQLCATDNYTKTCAGYPAQCRVGMLGILGTKLRTHCVCKGTDRAKLYECMGWQRVLWFNPCVVEAQREFHMSKVRARLSHKHHNVSGSIVHGDHDIALTTLPTVLIERHTVTATSVPTTTTLATTTMTTSTTTTVKPTTITTTQRVKQTTTTPTTTTTRPLTTTLASTTKQDAQTKGKSNPTTTSTSPATESDTKIFRSNNGLSKAINRGRPGQLGSTHPPVNVQLPPNKETNHKSIATSTVISGRPATSPTSPRSPKTTYAPQAGCILQKTSLDDEMLIVEGKAIRFYHQFEDDCSEVCYCATRSMLRCQTECIQPQSCRTDAAVYKHGSPGFLALRGRCLCYSGNFICIRPVAGTYTIPPGVFLYLGYSSIDEDLMKKHVNFELQDAVREFQELLNRKTASEATCQLSLFSVSDGNAIVIAKFKNMTKNYTRQTQLNPSLEEIEKDEESCHSSLQDLAKNVNEQDYDVKTNVFLSIFKIADVGVIHPEDKTPSSGTRIFPIAIFLLSFVVYIINGQ